MSIWQKNGYLDRSVWININFPSSTPPHTSSLAELPDKMQDLSSSGSPQALNTPSIGERKNQIFAKEGLEYTIWEPKLRKNFGIEDLKFIKHISGDKIDQFLDEYKKNRMQQRALKSVLRELKSLYIEVFDIQCITELPVILCNKVKDLILNRNEDDEVSKLLSELECTIWKWNQNSTLSYQYLICIATLSLFGFCLEKFCFKTHLKLKHLQNMSSMLKENFNELNSLDRKELKEAHVLQIALNNPFEALKVVTFIQEKLEGVIYHRI